MQGLFDDWQAKGITSVLHEKRGGYANNTASMHGLAAKAEARACGSSTGVEVNGLRVRQQQPGGHRARDLARAGSPATTSSSASARGSTTSGTCSNCRGHHRIKGRDGKMHDDVPMWNYWCLEEGTLGVDPDMHKTNDGGCRR